MEEGEAEVEEAGIIFIVLDTIVSSCIQKE